MIFLKIAYGCHKETYARKAGLNRELSFGQSVSGKKSA